MKITEELLAELEEAASGMQGWQNNAAFGVNGEWSVGCIDEDGNKYPVIEVHPEWYDQEHHAEPMAEYYAAANPATVLSLIARVRELEKDAARYRWLSQRLVGASFDWDDEGMTVLAFEMPYGLSVHADCNAVIDAAMQNPTNGTTNTKPTG